ncbi:hypothetical protein BJ508DRAFT_331595 [Ascobolus immersus RN42]|uniref:Uncharacterized protein n=1 Tax=Ascobolus immersus RN42 TaxID=1160509 RepID=A0A3N4HRS6_ASCIM|nr:hypothetical protein BJ508DRAFT_331595 [Ascobolus immersus RN42]
MPPSKGLFSRRKQSTEEAFGPTQFQASYGEDNGSSLATDGSPGNRVHQGESTPSRGHQSMLNPLPSSGRQKRPQIHGSSKPASTVVTAALGSAGGDALAFAPSAKSQGRRVVSTSENYHQSYSRPAPGHQHHQSYNGPAHAEKLSASLFPQTTTTTNGTTDKLKKNSILPARSKSDSITSTFQRITGGKRKEKEKDKERERQKERERLSSAAGEKELKHNQFSGGENYTRANGSSFDHGSRNGHSSLDFRLHHSLTSRQPRHHHQQFQPQSTNLRQNQPSYSEAPELRPTSSGSTVDSDQDVPPTPPTKSPIKAEFDIPPPPPPHTVPLPISPPPLDTSRPPIISPLDFEPPSSPSTPSTATPPPSHRRTRSDSLPAASGLTAMPARFDFGPSFDWMHTYNPPSTTSRPSSSPRTPTNNGNGDIGLGIGMPIMASENLDKVLRSSSSNLLNQPTPPKSNNDSLVMENELLRKALLQKNEIIKSLDPGRILSKSDAPKNETQRVNAILCRRVAVLEEALSSKEGAYKRAQDRHKEIKAAHQSLIETLRTSHAKEVAGLKSQITRLETAGGIGANFGGVGIDFDGFRGLREERNEKQERLSPFSLPPLPQRSGSAPNGHGKTEQVEDLRRMLAEEIARRKEAERKLEESAQRSRSDMELALTENERIRTQDTSAHILELRRTIEEERRARESTKRELVDANELVEQLRRDRDELVGHEERMRSEVNEELRELRGNYDDLMGRYEEVTEEADSLRGVVDELSLEVEEGRKEIDKMKQKIEIREQEIERLGKEYEESKKTKDELLEKAFAIGETLKKERLKNKGLQKEARAAGTSIRRTGSGGSSLLDIEPPLTPITPSPMTAGFPTDADTQQLRQLLDAKSREVDELLTENNSLREHCDLFKLDIKNYKRDARGLRKEIIALQSQVSFLSDSLALEKRLALPAGTPPSDIEGLLAGMISTIKDENLRFKAEITDLSERLKRSDTARQEAVDDNKTLKRKLETFTSQQSLVLQALEADVARLRTEKVQLQEESNRKINDLKLRLRDCPPSQKDEKLSYSALPSFGATDTFYPEFTPQLDRKSTFPVEEEPQGPLSDSDLPGRTLSGRRRKSESRKKVQAHQHKISIEAAELHRRASKRMSLETPLPSPPPKDIQFTHGGGPIRPAIGGPSRHTFGSGDAKPPSLQESLTQTKHGRSGSIVSALSAETPPPRSETVDSGSAGSWQVVNKEKEVERKVSVVSDLQKKEEDNELVIYW